MLLNRNRENASLQNGRRMIRQQFIRLLPYQVLLLVVNAVNGIVDSVFASNMIGQEAMTAIGMFGPLNHFLYALSIMLVSGSQILYGRYIAKNQQQEMRDLFSVNLAFSFLVSILLSAAMVVLAAVNPALLGKLEPAEQDAFARYLTGTAVGIPGLVLGQQLFAFLSLENQTRRTMTATLSCVAVNMAADFILIRAAGLGVLGLALASALSYWVFFAVMAAYYVSGKSELKFTLRGLKWKETGRIIRLGYSGSISRFVEMFRCMIVNSLILTWVGSVGLSSFAASNSVMAIFWAIPFGISAVNRMLLSISVGEEDRTGTVSIMSVINRVGILLVCGIAAVLVLFAEPLTRMFFRNPEDPVYGMTVMALRLLPLCMPLSVVSLTFGGYAQIIQKKIMSVVLPIVDGLVGVSVFSALLIPSLKMNGLYIANILNGVLCLLVVVGFSAAAIRRFPRNMEDLLAMPETFGAAESDRMEFTVRNEKEAAAIAERVEEFCLHKGIDRRRAAMAGLALEEMAENVVRYGLPADGKTAVGCEIRVTCKDGDVIIRLRDDCAPFDPSAWNEARHSDNPPETERIRDLADAAKDMQLHVGINLAFGVTKEMQYRNILGQNVLMIRV